MTHVDPGGALPLLLVTGFGPFPGVPDNPSAALARALDGATLGDWRVAGRVVDTAYRRGLDAAIGHARDLDAACVIGFGVAAGRAGVEVETVGRPALSERLDVDGERVLVHDAEVACTVDAPRLARCLDAGLSADAGSYVCNAFLLRLATALAVPVGFVHVPAGGADPDRVARGLDAYVNADSARTASGAPETTRRAGSPSSA